MWTKKRTIYTCPMLVTLEGWLRSGAHWEHDEKYNIWRLVDGNCVIGCRFPSWLIMLEHKFWCTYVGVWIRGKFEEKF